MNTMPGKKLIWCYVPGHAGVAVNEQADRLAVHATPTDTLYCYHQDITLPARSRSKKLTLSQLSQYEKGWRLLDKEVPYGHARTSHRTRRALHLYNQRLTGNISLPTL